VWAKISTSATAMACAACLAAAAVTLPAAEKAGSDLASTAEVNLAVDFSQLAGFDAIPAYISLLSGGGVDALSPLASVNALTTFFGTGGVFTGGGLDALLADGTPGFDALSALPVFVGTDGVFTGGGVNALANYAALSAIPVFIGTDPVTGAGTGVFNGGGVNALGGYAALSAVDTFFGDNNGAGGVFTGGGIDALAPDAAGNGGYAALSALPVFAGTGGVFTGGGVNALSGYAALSAIPAYLAPTPPVTPMAATATTLAATGGGAGAAGGGTTGTTLAAPLAAKVAVDPAPVVEKTPTPTANKNGSYSASFAPKQLVLFGSGGGKNAADNGISGWGGMLKKLGLNGGAPAGGTGGSAAGSGGTP
jgi:hypothetical protein